MLDDLRAQAGDLGFEPQEDQEVQDVYSIQEKVPVRRGPFLGMTPPQRFVIATMLLMMTCILSAFCLLVTEKLWLPFLS
jgi:hypothetical protein